MPEFVGNDPFRDDDRNQSIYAHPTLADYYASK